MSPDSELDLRLGGSWIKVDYRLIQLSKNLSNQSLVTKFDQKDDLTWKTWKWLNRDIN